MGTAVQGVEIGFNCHSNGTEKVSKRLVSKLVWIEATCN